MSTQSWRPLSQRSTASPEPALVEGIPAYLEGPIRTWFEEFALDVLGADGLRTIGLRLRIQWSANQPTPAHAAISLFNSARDRPDGRLDVLDASLMTGHEVASAPDASSSTLAAFMIRRGDLDEMLRLGGSAWRVASAGTSLERRVDPTSTEAFENAITVATSHHPSAAESLRTAWSNVYGRTPQYSAGYAEAIKAVESAAAPVVTPNDLKAQLGKIAGELQTQSASYRFTIARAPIDTVVAMMRSLELGQTDRHGGVQPTTPVTQEGAEAALHLAVVLVQWFSTGAIQHI